MCPASQPVHNRYLFTFVTNDFVAECRSHLELRPKCVSCRGSSLSVSRYPSLLRQLGEDCPVPGDSLGGLGLERTGKRQSLVFLFGMAVSVESCIFL